MSSFCQQAAQQSLKSQEGELQWWVGQVKAFQKDSCEARAKWHAYCASHGFGVRDPLRHDAAFIESFFRLKERGMLPDQQMPLHDMPLPSDVSVAEEYRPVLEARVQHRCRDPGYKRNFQQRFRGTPLRFICAEALLRFVQVQEVARGKDPFAAPPRFRSPLAELVKRMQSSRICWRIQWVAYVDAAGRGVRDPSRHPTEFLDGFLTSAKPHCPKEWRSAALQLCTGAASKQSTSSVFAVGSEDSNCSDSHFSVEVPSENDCTTFSYSHTHRWQQRPDMSLSQAEDADQGKCTTGHAVRGPHIESNNGNWGNFHFSMMLPSRNESMMSSCSQPPCHWRQQANVGVDKMQSIGPLLVMPKDAHPDSQNACIDMFVSQTEDVTGQANRGRHVGSEVGDWEDPQYSAMMSSGNQCGLFSHCRPRAQQAVVRVDEIHPMHIKPLPVPKAADPNYQDPCADMFASQAEDATGQAIRDFEKQRARPSSMPPLRSSTCKAVSYAYGVQIRNTFLEWQEPKALKRGT